MLTLFQQVCTVVYTLYIRIISWDGWEALHVKAWILGSYEDCGAEVGRLPYFGIWLQRRIIFLMSTNIWGGAAALWELERGLLRLLELGPSCLAGRGRVEEAGESRRRVGEGRPTGRPH